MEYLATTSFAMEGVLKNELTLMGYEVERTSPGQCLFRGDMEALIWANASLRSAERVFLVLGRWEARSFDELYDGVMQLPLEDILPSSARFPVNARSFKSELFSLRDIQSVTKKAVVDRLGKAYKMKTLPEDGTDYPLMLRMEQDEAILLLDTSGEPLHKRGYRVSGHIAPIRENLGAALILLSRWFGKGPFIDPMCGSGTLPIEAAMIATNRPPGLERDFLFEKWGILDTVRTQEIRETMRSRIKPAETVIQGYDKEPRAIRMSRKNASSFGLDSLIHFQCRDLEEFSTSLRGGTIGTNMPYGERMGNREEMIELNHLFDRKILHLDTFRLGVLSGDAWFAQGKSRKPTRVRKFYNGKIITYYYQFEPLSRR